MSVLSVKKLRQWLRLDEANDSDDNLQFALDSAETLFAEWTGRNFNAATNGMPPDAPETIAIFYLAGQSLEHREGVSTQTIHELPRSLRAIINRSAGVEV